MTKPTKGAPASKNTVATKPAPVKKAARPKQEDVAPNEVLLASMAADAKAKRAPTQDELSKIAALADELARINDFIIRGTEALKQKAARRDEIMSKDLLDVLDAASMDSMGLPQYEADIKVSTKYRASLPAIPEPHKDNYEEKVAQRARGLKFLRDDGHDGLIVTEMVVTFPRGGLQRALQLEAELQDRAKEYADTHDGVEPYGIETKETVHHSALTSLVKSLTEDKGRTDLPLADLGASIFRIAEIKPRSERKKKN